MIQAPVRLPCRSNSKVTLEVEALRPRLTKMATYYARSTGMDPDDLLQEAWIGMLDALPALDRTIGCSQQYLVAHAKWRLLDSVRKSKTRSDRLPSDSLELEGCILSQGPKCTLHVDVAIQDFIDGLSSSQRTVVECLTTGMTWREAGESMGCSSANIAYHVRQIQKKLSSWLDVD